MSNLENKVCEPSTGNQQHEFVIRIDRYGLVSVAVDGKQIGLISSISFNVGVDVAKPECKIVFANISKLVTIQKHLEDSIKESTEFLSQIPFCETERST